MREMCLSSASRSRCVCANAARGPVQGGPGAGEGKGGRERMQNCFSIAD